MAVNAQAAARAAKIAWDSQNQAAMREALQGCDTVLKSFPEEKVVEGSGAPDMTDPLAAERALLWLWRGRFLVVADNPDLVVKGLQSLDQAIARLVAAGERPEAAELLTIAWMNRGSGLFRLGSPEALAEAVRCYDKAIALLERAPETARNALGAALMNRGVGLMHLDQVKDSPESIEARLADALRSLERAVEVLQPLASAQAAAQRNLASAWANLGMLHTRRKNTEAALVAHRQAVELFRPIAAQTGSPGAFELAARVFNHAQASGEAGHTEAALAAGREAIALADTVDAAEPHAAELGLRARHAVCVVLGGLLAAGRVQADDPERSARLEEAGDLVEDGLARLKARPETTVGMMAAGARLYEFGAWLYRTQQPRFLGEFLLEHLGDDPLRAQIAEASVQAARQAYVQRNFNDIGHGGMDRVLDALQSLGEVEARLKERKAVV
jgi:tetratricopeptide (TPR) repeat protein